jgi:copper oxidase (laccase) domain-containing protein
VVAEGIIRPGRPGHARVSLADAIRCQIEARTPPATVHTVRRCTYDEPEAFFSYRRDGPRTGRHALVAGWLE